MSTTVPTIDELDLEIAVAFIALGGARGVFARCPSSENSSRVDAAEAALDELLDQRLGLRPLAA